MAKVEISNAFVEEQMQGSNGVWGLKVSEPHSKKNDAGEWETTARTFFMLKASRESGVNLADFVKGDRISVRGNQKTEVSEKDGRKFYNLVVWVDEVQRQGQSRQAAQQDTGWNAPAQPGNGWNKPAESNWGQAVQEGKPF